MCVCVVCVCVVCVCCVCVHGSPPCKSGMCTLHDCQPYLQHLGVNQTRLVVIESLEGEGEGEGGRERKGGRERRESGEEGGSFRKKGRGGGGTER